MVGEMMVTLQLRLSSYGSQCYLMMVSLCFSSAIGTVVSPMFLVLLYPSLAKNQVGDGMKKMRQIMKLIALHDACQHYLRWNVCVVADDSTFSSSAPTVATFAHRLQKKMMTTLQHANMLEVAMNSLQQLS